MRVTSAHVRRSSYSHYDQEAVVSSGAQRTEAELLTVVRAPEAQQPFKCHNLNSIAQLAARHYTKAPAIRG